jgi:cytochrome P450 family 6
MEFNRSYCFCRKANSSPFTDVRISAAGRLTQLLFTEALQNYPPIPILKRECTKDYEIPGTDVVLENGMTTVIPIYALHRDPKYYPEPERFDPERFNANEKAKRHQFVYLPFGEGPRICIGTFAVQ